MLIKGILRQSEQSNFGSAQDVDFELCGNMGISQQLDSKEWYVCCMQGYRSRCNLIDRPNGSCNFHKKSKYLILAHLKDFEPLPGAA